MSVPSKESTSTEKFLYRYGKLLGLCPFDVCDLDTVNFSYRGLVYGLMLIVLFSWIFFKSMERRVETKLPGETTMAMLTNCSADFFQIASMFTTWILLAFRQRKIRTIVDTFVGTGVTASKLGIVNSERERFFEKLAIHAIIINITFLSYMTIDHAQLLLHIKFQDPTYFVLFNGGHVICRNLIIIFVHSVSLIRDRFARLNETAKNLAIIGRDVRNVTNLRIGCRSVSSLTKRIEIVGQLHRELTELAEMIRDFCSLPLLIIITMHFIQMVTNCYITWLSILAYRSMDWQDFVSFLMVSIWLTVNVLEPFVITDVCDSTTKEARRTAAVLHEMWNEYSSTPYSSCNHVIDMVSLSLHQNRLNMTLYGFFDLDHKLMYKIFGTTTTYVIIMMQLDQQHTAKFRNYSLKSSHFH